MTDNLQDLDEHVKKKSTYYTIFLTVDRARYWNDRYAHTSWKIMFANMF